VTDRCTGQVAQWDLSFVAAAAPFTNTRVRMCITRPISLAWNRREKCITFKLHYNNFDLSKRRYLMTISFMWCAYRMTTYRCPKSPFSDITLMFQQNILIYNRPLAEIHNVELQKLFKLLSANLNAHFISPKHCFTNCCT